MNKCHSDLTVIISQNIHSDLAPIICDVLNVADAETSVFENHEESKERHNFSYIVRECEKVILNAIFSM